MNAEVMHFFLIKKINASLESSSTSAVPVANADGSKKANACLIRLTKIIDELQGCGELSRDQIHQCSHLSERLSGLANKFALN